MGRHTSEGKVEREYARRRRQRDNGFVWGSAGRGGVN